MDLSLPQIWVIIGLLMLVAELGKCCPRFCIFCRWWIDNSFTGSDWSTTRS